MEKEPCPNRSFFSVSTSKSIIVRPESKTPDETYFLSNLDHHFPVIVQLLYFFKPEKGKSSDPVGAVMQQALAKVLVHFYPLSGCLAEGSDGKFIVKCTDGGGVPFIEAAADCDMDLLGDIIFPPDPKVLGKLVYVVKGAESLMEMPLLTAQVTKFKCGGFVLGVAIHHFLVDGLSTMQFINSWGETARGIALTNPPFLDRSILKSRNPPEVQYAHNELLDLDDISNMANLFKAEELVYKSFDFLPERLAELKKWAMEDGVVSRCTSFAVLTALVWRARSQVLNMEGNQRTKILFPVDVRPKLRDHNNQPFPKGYFGNGVVLTCGLCTAAELQEKPFSFAVKLVQEAIMNVNEQFIRSSVDYFEVARARPSLTATLLVTSWTRLPFTPDFGWGKPTQSGRANLPNKEVAIFLSGAKGKGIRVLIGLPVSSMKKFQELMRYGKNRGPRDSVFVVPRL